MRGLFKFMVAVFAGAAGAFAGAADAPGGSAPAPAAAGVLLDGVAAMVNGHAITMAEVMAEVRAKIPEMMAEPGFHAKSREEVFNLAYERGLDDLIAFRLIVQSYQAGSARIPEAALEKERARIIETYYGGDAGALRADLARDRRTYDDWKKRTEEQLVAVSMRRAVVDENISVSPNAVRREYEARKAEFTTGASAHILIYAVPEGADADAALAEFARRRGAGESFGALARESSADAMAENGGDYGWIEPDAYLAPELAAAVRATADGALSAPVTLGGRRYVIWRKASRPGRTAPLGEAVEAVGAQLRRREAERLYAAWVGRLTAAAAILRYERDKAGGGAGG